MAHSALGLAIVAVVVLADGSMAAAVSLPRPSDLGLQGTLTYKNYSQFQDVADDGNFVNQGILEIDWHRAFFDRRVRVKIVPEFRIDDANYAKGVHFVVPDTREHRSIIDLKEGTVLLRIGSVRFGLGKQFESWGTADAYNPTDNVNPYDYLDPIDNFKMGVYSATTAFSLLGVNVDFVVVPPFTPSRLPFQNGRWGTVVIQGVSAPSVPPSAPGIDVGQIRTVFDVPGTDVDNMQYALRMKTTYHGWDFALSYYNGIQDTPDVDDRTTTLASLAATGTIRLFNPHVQIPGFAFSTTWDRFEFHGEAVSIFGSSHGRPDRFQGIIGLNYTWDITDWKWLDQVLFMLEYAREEEYTSSGSAFVDFGSLSNAFRNAPATRTRLKFNEETQFSVFSTVDLTKSANYFAKLELEHEFTDALHLTTGFDLFDGDTDTFWGRWADNDRFYAFLRYYF